MTKEEIIQGLYRGDSRAIKEAIKALEQQPCEDKVTITMDKGTLKYSGKGYVVYNKDWFRKHFAMEVAIMTGYDGYIEQPYEEFCSLPPVTPTQSWIPVSEKLPKKNMPCLVSVGDFNLTQIAMYSDLMHTIDHKIFYQGNYGHDSFMDITKYVKAWMPLPKPYKAEMVGAENE